MKRYSIFILLVLFFFVFSSPSHAEIYKWTDKNGVVHFSSEAGDPSAELVTEKDLPPVSETGEVPPSIPSNLVPDKNVYPPEHSVTILLQYDGKPLPEFTSAPPLIQLYNRELKHWFTPESSYDVLTGNLYVKNIAKGKYWSQLSVYTRQKTFGEYPGDYKGNVAFTVMPDARNNAKADLQRIIHLTSPQDNSKPLDEWSRDITYKEFETPVVISWEPLGKDITYIYSIRRGVRSPFAIKEMVVGDKISASRVVLSLPPNKEGEFYSLKLEARKHDKVVGTITIHGHNSYGWDYRFRVIPKRGPTRTISPNTQ